MIKTTDNEPKPRPAGYLALAERYKIRVPRNWHSSRVAESKIHRIDTKGRFVDETYPRSYWPGEKLSDHLEFALKYDGINLAILGTLFRQPVEAELLAYIQSKPTGKYARQLWFLYEFLTGNTLPLDDLKRGNYIDLLNPEKYYTVEPAQRARRQRINNNLLGNPDFCPTIRRTESLRDLETANLADRCRDVVSNYSSSLIRRALNYLYTRETKSSFAIEHVDISGDRIVRFMALLQQAEQEDFCEETRLVTLQNRIVPDRFGESKFRSIQNYVGETVFMDQERIHYVCPKPEDLAGLMDGLIAAHQRIESGNVH
ncbi:MAG: cell filamentation protein Fic, partial [Candidatus Hydrogenedentes bacterium]|nr:cell filamentation protein Fic [Candidatus Hydrogenedentota bacterium]